MVSGEVASGAATSEASGSPAPAVIDLDGLVRLLASRPRETRTILAIAGPPGGGKSTVAEALVDRLNAAEPGVAALLPMDGYHYDDLHLVPAGLRPRKGSPETFDVGGLRAMLERLARDDEEFVAVPVFDRAIEIARAGARLIPRTARIIVAEGNYLLLADTPWDGLAPFFDFTVMIEVPEEELRRRLTERWQHYRLTPDEIAFKLDVNDLPNGRFVAAASRAADYRLLNDRAGA
ncbi:nucleoside/nucleotide kinase family protein [Kaistia geumhonensis]|uniref:Pantothenate kinase n=1 Tax=Kaistia geumhonensis TaxID=410839 RepID=A0ABU0M7U7_9HYPH|nr:nucleoside/nucleotide kinase family protein [Kaistia geumhonensis]MCX5477747.1 nucleoside/nucleotide kinase family protein [Kaistia geumhonensis]MDQ0517042.1 pantothenate kinase [Kaistia geumhonensis]